MKTWILVTLLATSTLFAQSGKTTKDEDIKLIQEGVAIQADEDAYDDFNSLEKWIFYDLPEEDSTPHAKHKPAMVFLLRGDAVVAQYYFQFSDALKGYGKPGCNCCHVHAHDGDVEAHCEATCTKMPYATRQEVLDVAKQLTPSNWIKY